MKTIFVRSIYLIIGGLIISVLIYSCTRQTIYNIFDSVRIESVKQTSQSGGRIMHDNDICKVDSFYISFHFNYRSIAYQQNNEWSLIPKANAYKPAPPMVHHLEKLKDICVFTLNDFNQTYPAGSEITELVSIPMKLNNDTTTTLVSIEEFVQKYNEEQVHINYHSFAGGSFRLSETSHAPAYHRFYIKTVTESETVLTDSTANIYIIP